MRNRLVLAGRHKRISNLSDGFVGEDCQHSSGTSGGDVGLRPRMESARVYTAHFPEVGLL